MLPEPLPTDPEELEELFHTLTSQGKVAQADLDRLMEARLRAWGYDPQHITPDQILKLMEESTNRLLINLYGAMDTAPDESSRDQIKEIIEQAGSLRDQIYHMLDQH